MPQSTLLFLLGAYDFLKSLSKALRASSAFRGAGGPAGGGAGCPLLETPSRAMVTRGAKSGQSLALSFTAILAGIGLRHWKRVEGSKWVHCLQQCSSALHLGQVPAKSMPGGSVVAQLKHRAAATCCTRRGSRDPLCQSAGAALAASALRETAWNRGPYPGSRVVCICGRCPLGNCSVVSRTSTHRNRTPGACEILALGSLKRFGGIPGTNATHWNPLCFLYLCTTDRLNCTHNSERRAKLSSNST